MTPRAAALPAARWSARQEPRSGDGAGESGSERPLHAARLKAGLIGLVLALAAGNAHPARGFTPRWEPGLTWTVSTVYRGTPLGKVRPEQGPRKPEWSPPTHWMYYVSRVEERQGVTYYLVQVKDREHESSALASLVFGSHALTGGGRSLVLLRGKFLKMVRDERVVSDTEQNEPGQPARPVLSEQSIIPYDFPATPLLDPEADAPRRQRFEIEQVFEPMVFAKDIEQLEETGLDPSKFSGGEIAGRSGFPELPARRMVFVELSRRFDGYLCRQVWSPDLPWPLFSDNGYSRSVLIYHSKELSVSPAGSTTATTVTTP